MQKNSYFQFFSGRLAKSFIYYLIVTSFMESEKLSNLSLEQKILATATGIFAGLGTLWLIYDVPDVITKQANPYGTIKDAVFNIGVPTLAYVSAAASLYLTKLFPNRMNT